MNRITLALLTTLLFCSAAQAENLQNLEWGMNELEIRRAMNVELRGDSLALGYTEKNGTFEYSLIITLTDDRLHSLLEVFKTDLSNATALFRIFEQYRDKLVSRFGGWDSIKYTNSVGNEITNFAVSPDKWLSGITANEINVIYEWEDLESSSINLMMARGDDGFIRVFLSSNEKPNVVSKAHGLWNRALSVIK